MHVVCLSWRNLSNGLSDACGAVLSAVSGSGLPGPGNGFVGRAAGITGTTGGGLLPYLAPGVLLADGS